MSPVPDRRPLYLQVAEELRRDVVQGRKPGDPLPSIRALQERFQVANMTLRAALGVLRDEGLIYTVQGRGSYVTGGAEEPVTGEGISWAALVGMVVELREEVGELRRLVEELRAGRGV
jgi:GntR family transcriptional regulator